MAGDSQVPNWWIYKGTNHPGRPEIPAAPPWRTFPGRPPRDEAHRMPGAGHPDIDPTWDRRLGRYREAVAYQADEREINLINLALYLRRPLLVTGPAGAGKSTLAESVAYELGLGPVLRWPITSRTTRQDGLYHYDSVGRLHEVSVQRQEASDGRSPASSIDIGAYIRLEALGTALLPWSRPRVLLIDEIDKSDIDLPGDLLNIFEDGEFKIPELARLKDSAPVRVGTVDRGGFADITSGLVQCAQFPFIILTSNAERDFPVAFKRRCIRLEMAPPTKEKLAAMVEAHLGPATPGAAAARKEVVQKLIEKFLEKQEGGDVLSRDQLLNALLMADEGLWNGQKGQELIFGDLLKPLNQA